MIGIISLTGPMAYLLALATQRLGKVSSTVASVSESAPVDATIPVPGVVSGPITVSPLLQVPPSTVTLPSSELIIPTVACKTLLVAENSALTGLTK